MGRAESEAGVGKVMQRREFITLLGGAATWPLAANAQQPAIPVIGFLSSLSLAATERFVAAFRQALTQSGYVDGRSLTIEYRWAEGAYGRLPALAADLVGRHVAVIAAFGPPAALAAKANTNTIPIVFVHGSDPAKLGLVASLNRPGGNITGINFFGNVLDAKRLELLHKVVPAAELIAVLLNPTGAGAESQLREVQVAARVIGKKIVVLNASVEADFDVISAMIQQQPTGGLLEVADPFFTERRETIIALAARHHIPAIYELREFVMAGGLMSYGTSLVDAYRQAGLYTARILKGEKPADLPVMQSIKFEFVLNLKTAKTLGLEIPPSLLAIADEVIE
jgi:putative tryptophan/tyrosine transport system substrate-binding protein